MCVTCLIRCSKLAWELAGPPDCREAVLGVEFKNSLAGFEISNNCALVLRRAGNEVWVSQTPIDSQNALLVQVLEGCHWVLRVSQVPDVEAGIAVVIRCNNELSGDNRVPNDLRLFGLNLGFGCIRLPSVEVVILRGTLLGLGELENRLGLLQVPNHNLSIFARTCKNMRHHSIPADRSNEVAIMEVGLARLELGWLFQV